MMYCLLLVSCMMVALLQGTESSDQKITTIHSAFRVGGLSPATFIHKSVSGVELQAEIVESDLGIGMKSLLLTQRIGHKDSFGEQSWGEFLNITKIQDQVCLIGKRSAVYLEGPRHEVSDSIIKSAQDFILRLAGRVCESMDVTRNNNTTRVLVTCDTDRRKCVVIKSLPNGSEHVFYPQDYESIVCYNPAAGKLIGWNSTIEREFSTISSCRIIPSETNLNMRLIAGQKNDQEVVMISTLSSEESRQIELCAVPSEKQHVLGTSIVMCEGKPSIFVGVVGLEIGGEESAKTEVKLWIKNYNCSGELQTEQCVFSDLLDENSTKMPQSFVVEHGERDELVVKIAGIKIIKTPGEQTPKGFLWIKAVKFSGDTLIEEASQPIDRLERMPPQIVENSGSELAMLYVSSKNPYKLEEFRVGTSR